jgi:signal transduction histidine kinase
MRGRLAMLDALAQSPARSEAAPGGRRRESRRTRGVQGNLILAFSGLLMVALATTSWLFVKNSRHALADVMGEQARQIAQTLAMGTADPYAAKDVGQLNKLGRDLLHSRNIVLVAFHDPIGAPLAMNCRDPDLTLQRWQVMPGSQPNTQNLMQVQPRTIGSLGEFLQITAPVMATAGAQARTHLLGYLTIGLSQSKEQALLQRVTLMGVGMGCVIFLLSLPLASGLVHRIFLPIRQLAEAANRIAAGDYGVQVATDRPDEIGVLARSFNEMALRIEEHQQALKEANRDLETKVQVRTGELESSNKRLSAEIAEKEDFLRAVSHDLNAPLRNIGGMAGMLLLKNRQQFTAEIIHRLERIQKNVEVETDLISELLELSRIKTRRQKMEPVDLNEMVQDVAGIFEQDLKEKEISLHIEDSLPMLSCEKARLRQVFQNLIDNAIKYMGTGSLREIRIGCQLKSGEAEFYVRDTGIGIDKDDIAKVFYVFRRGRNSAEMKVAGKGVGLASVKSIIETYDGRIWVESDVGRGSAFRFTIPARFVPALAGEGRSGPQPGTSDPPAASAA